MDDSQVITAEDEAETTPAGEPNPAAERFDFRHPVFLSSSEWRKLRKEVNEFVESAGSLLSTYLRLDFSFQLGNLQTIAFSELTASLPAPTHLVLFKTDPLRGISVIEVRSNIAQAVVDRLLGGPGKASADVRPLTDMECALMDQFVQLILDEWCKMWAKQQKLDSEILGHETNPKFLQCATPDTVLLVLTLNARLAESEGTIQLAVPYAAFEPLVHKLTQSDVVDAAAPATPAMSAPKWTKNLDKVPVRLQAQWPAMKIATRALLELKVGSVLDLRAEDSEQLELRVGKMTKFRARLGTRDQKWAVQITEVCKL